MSDTVRNGSRRNIDGKPCVSYDGYWIKWYEPPQDSLAAKKRLVPLDPVSVIRHARLAVDVPPAAVAHRV